MSRIGRMPIKLPTGVSVTISGQLVTVKGPKGQLQMTIPEPIRIKQDAEVLSVSRPDDTKDARSRHGLSRALVNNMVLGVTDGFVKKLEVTGVGYKAVSQGSVLELTIGLSHAVLYEVPKTVEVKVERNVITVSGIDKQQVGEVAATIRRYKKPSVYSGKGIRYQGEFVRRKVGKAAAS